MYITGTIRGPGWPSRYPNNALKCWRIKSRHTTKVVRLTISTLSMQSCSGCSCDSIEVFDGSSVYSRSLGKFCSGRRVVTSTGQYLYVKFSSDSTTTGNAFTATYIAVQRGKSSFVFASIIPEKTTWETGEIAPALPSKTCRTFLLS